MDVQQALGFHVGKLAFEQKVARRQRRGRSVPGRSRWLRDHLCEDAARNDRVRLFLELSVDGVDQPRQETVERSVRKDIGSGNAIMHAKAPHS